jgi:hypothetical protein
MFFVGDGGYSTELFKVNVHKWDFLAPGVSRTRSQGKEKLLALHNSSLLRLSPSCTGD